MLVLDLQGSRVMNPMLSSVDSIKAMSPNQDVGYPRENG